MRFLRYGVAAAATAAVGGRSTRRSVETWYPALDKPRWTPPSRAFGPVWTLLYAQMALSAALVDRADGRSRRAAEALWWLQLGLNGAWPPVFFGRRRIGAGVAILSALVPAIAATAAASAGSSRVAGALYVPYIGWASYATALNASIWRRNRR
jgi:tryptophan-rich sensory protein